MLGVGQLPALEAEPTVVGLALVLVSALQWAPRAVASEGSMSLSGAGVAVAQEEADG